MLATILIPLQLAATLSATRYESTTESQVNGAQATVSRTVTTVGDRNVRFEVLEAAGSRSPSTPSYMLLRTREMKMYSVDTAKHEYSEVDIAKMQSQLTSTMRAMGGRMKFSGIDYSVEEVGEGEVILGHPTRHWRMNQSMTMTMVMDTDSMSMATESATDLYFAKDLEVPNNPGAAGDTSSLAQFRNLIPEFNLAKARAQLSRLPKTLLLRSITKATTRTGGIATTTSSTTNVTKVETVAVPASMLEIPPTYKKVDMFPVPEVNKER